MAGSNGYNRGPSEKESVSSGRIVAGYSGVMAAALVVPGILELASLRMSQVARWF